MRRGEIAVLSILACTIAAIVGSALPAQAVTITPDRDFAGDGRTSLNLPGYDFATDVVIDGNTSYVIGDARLRGSKNDYRMAVAKYGPGGHLDRSFGDHGKKFLLIGRHCRAYSGALAPDGGILVAGWSVTRDAAYVVIAKLRPRGALDRTFSGDGVTRVALKDGAEWPLVESEPDGSIWLTWASVRNYNYDKHVSDLRVMHFTHNGRVDHSFSGDGVRTFDFRRRDFTYFSDVDSTGRLFVTGFANARPKATGVTSVLSVDDKGPAYTRTLAPWAKAGSFPLTVDSDSSDNVVVGMSPYQKKGWGAVRLSTDLRLDHSYGHDGVARHDCRCLSTSGALTSQGLVLVGNDNRDQQRTVVARFNANGRWDRQLGNASYNLFPDWEYWVETEVDASGRLVLAGTVKDQSGDLAIARLEMSPV